MLISLILSGGTGNRVGGDVPKQYLNVAGREIISYSIETLSTSDDVNMLWIVADDKWKSEVTQIANKYDIKAKLKGISKPGATRQLSIYQGIKDIELYLDKEGINKSDTFVLVHDAARPNLTHKDISEYVTAHEGHDGVLPVLPMKDTVYFSNEGTKVDSLLERSKIYAGQAPEIFALDKYIKANEELITFDKDGNIDRASKIYEIKGSTEVAILAGMDIAMVPGDEGNFKITTLKDLEDFKAMKEKA